MWYALDNEDTKAWVKEFGGQMVDVWDFSTNPQNPLEPEKNYFWAKVRSLQDWKYVPKTARVMVSKEGAPNEFFTKSFAPDLSKEIAAGQVRFQKFFQRRGQDGEGEGGDGEPQPGGEPQPKVGKDLEKHAAKLRAIADGMTKEIKHRLDPPIGKQNKTQRRIRIAAGMREEGVKMLRIQTCLYSVADAIDANVAVSDLMLELNSKADFEALEFEYEYKVKNPNKPFKVPERLVKKGVLTEKQFDELWWELAKLVNAGKTPQSESEAKIRELEEKVRRATDELVGEKIPGFFPTPKPLIERMIEAADIKDGMTILEPSSGKGDIVYHLVENEPTSKLKLEVWSVEPQGSLTWVQRLRNDLYAEKHEQNPAKYVNGPARIRLVETSLEKYQGSYNRSEFDRVLMNPPFEGGKDIEHVRLCYNMLKPGGILVAIMSIGSFQRSYKKEREFQEWISELEVNGLAFSDTIKNAFNTRDSFNQTGVTVKLVQLYKPSGAKPSSPNDDDDLELIELEAEAQIAITNTNSLTAQKATLKGLDEDLLLGYFGEEVGLPNKEVWLTVAGVKHIEIRHSQELSQHKFNAVELVRYVFSNHGQPMLSPQGSFMLACPLPARNNKFGIIAIVLSTNYDGNYVVATAFIALESYVEKLASHSRRRAPD